MESTFVSRNSANIVSQHLTKLLLSIIAYHTDALLLEHFRAGNETAFRELYLRLHEKVLFTARRILANNQAAEDVTAETFVQLWQHRSQIETLSDAAAWMNTSIRNRCFDVLRREQRMSKHLQQLVTEDVTESAEKDLIHLELINLIYAEVDRLPKKMKEIFLLSYREGLKPAEIAERLKLSVQTVKNQRVTAIRLLKAALNDNAAAIVVLMMIEMQG